MIYASIIIMIILLLLYVISFRNRENMPTGMDRKNHKLYFLYPMAELFLKKTGLYKRLIDRADISRKIRSLYISDHQDYQIKLYWYQKTSLFLFVIFVFSSISMLISLQDFSKPRVLDANITRPKEGQGDSRLSLQFRMENENNKEEVYEDEITIKNKERIYTDGEWKEVIGKAIPYLEQELLGENEALEHIDKDLNFIRSIPDTGIIIDWIPRDYRLISSDGRLMNEELSDDSMDTQVTAILKYKDKRVEHTIPLTIWPEELDKISLLYRELERALDTREQETGTAVEWSLPGKVGDYLLTWQVPEGNTAFSVLILGLIGAIIIWLLMDKSLDKKMKLRKNQMLLDYPEIINKFNLLINAGMTIRQAWNKICEDYKQKADLSGWQIRYAYEEMLLTLHEIRLGIPEVSAYEQFGMRAGLLPYMKFSSILVQNIKKGNKSMIDLLRQEAMEAFHDRKETTKRLGEEASTKLLAPMMIMLLIVLIIILIPAFVSFQM